MKNLDLCNVSDTYFERDDQIFSLNSDVDLSQLERDIARIKIPDEFSFWSELSDRTLPDMIIGKGSNVHLQNFPTGTYMPLHSTHRNLFPHMRLIFCVAITSPSLASSDFSQLSHIATDISGDSPGQIDDSFIFSEVTSVSIGTLSTEI